MKKYFIDVQNFFFLIAQCTQFIIHIAKTNAV